MKLEEYQMLPDVLSVKEVKQLFLNAMSDFTKGTLNKREFLEIMCEITDRQGMTYQLLEEKLKKKIDLMMCNLWNIDSYDDVDDILFIVVNLGLESCSNKAKETIENPGNIPEDIYKEIQETVEEVGENILNPYASM